MKYTFFLIAFHCSLTVFGQDTLEYAQVFYKGAWRIIDRKGDFILKRQFGVGAYQELCFCDNGAISSENGKFGFTDFSNNQLVPNKYDALHCFMRGYAPAAIGNRWGLINKKGDFVVPPVYDYVGTFSSSYVAPVIKGQKIGLVDTTGKLVSPFNYYWLHSVSVRPGYPIFINGLITVAQTDDPENLRGAKMGCMNERGELVIPAIYDYVGFFDNDGIASASKDGNTFLIDTLGNIKLKLDGESLGPLFFIDDYSRLHKRDGGVGMIKKNGQVILEPKYASVYPFSNGLALVEIPDSAMQIKANFVDTSGRFVFDQPFDAARSFIYGIAAFKINGKWGYMDTTGRVIVEPKYHDARDFNEGLAAVAIKANGKARYGFIDATGRWALKPAYEDVWRFDCGLAPVKVGGKYGFIDKAGNMIIKPKFDNAFGFHQEILGCK